MLRFINMYFRQTMFGGLRIGCFHYCTKFSDESNQNRETIIVLGEKQK